MIEIIEKLPYKVKYKMICPDCLCNFRFEEEDITYYISDDISVFCPNCHKEIALHQYKDIPPGCTEKYVSLDKYYAERRARSIKFIRNGVKDDK